MLSKRVYKIRTIKNIVKVNTAKCVICTGKIRFIEGLGEVLELRLRRGFCRKYADYKNI